MSESRLAPVWSALRAAQRRALIPYLTAGYPTPEASLQALRAADRVSDILEVGVPFSDPLADGPTIQRSTFEALRKESADRLTEIGFDEYLADPDAVLR